METLLVASVHETGRETRQVHYSGLPPIEGGLDHREPLPEGEVLAIERNKSGIFLYRYLRDGTCVGDTWHMSTEEAMDQAKYEFGEALGTWREVPPGVDPLSFALKSANDEAS
jgi:hypothetical protein